MSKKDLKKGIEMQAEVDAKAHEKVAKGLENLGEKVNQLKDSHSSIRKTIGIVLEDMKDLQAKARYGLDPTRTPLDLDDNTKQYLCSLLYSLSLEQDPTSEKQKEFICHFEDYLETTNRSICDYNNLNNIDSLSDRAIILEVICSFLFLKNNDLSFKDNEKYQWLYDFETSKKIDNVCEYVQKEFESLGVDALISKYQKPQVEEPIEEVKEATVFEQETLINEVVDEINDPYAKLKEIILRYTRDEISFGKSLNGSPHLALKDIQRTFKKISPNSIVSISKVGNGFLLFTTVAMYIKENEKLLAPYRRIMYSSINIGDISSSIGREKGTKKVSIPYIDETGSQRTITIDDSKITEEKLIDLIKEIVTSGCETAKNDMWLDFSDLSINEKILYFKALGNILVREEYGLAELYLLIQDYCLDEKWDDIAEGFDEDEKLEIFIRSFLENVPYPSEDDISIQAILLALQTICRTNIIEGEEVSKIYETTENFIKLFDVVGLNEKNFNAILTTACGNKRKTNLNDLHYLLERLPKDTAYYDSIKSGAEAIAQQIEEEIKKQKNSLPNRMLNRIMSPTKGKHLSIPAYYKMVENLPNNIGLPNDAIGFSGSTSMSSMLLINYQVSEEESMPFNNNETIINSLQKELGENECLIEVGNGTTKKGKPYVYDIIKQKMPEKDGIPSGMNYTLNINVKTKDGIQFFNGSFAEEGITGTRDSIIYAAYIKAKEGKPEEINQWFYDPYNPDRKDGLLMNLSEKNGFDSKFPDHPLSKAREFVKYIIEKN